MLFWGNVFYVQNRRKGSLGKGFSHSNPWARTQEGFLLHRVLPETLRQLSEANPVNEELEAELKSILNEVDSSEDKSASDVCKDWESLLLNVHNDGELSYAEINQKRKQLTFASFRNPDFMDRTLLLEFLMAPLVQGMDFFLNRSGGLSTLHHLPASKTDYQEKIMMRPGLWTWFWTDGFKKIRVKVKVII